MLLGKHLIIISVLISNIQAWPTVKIHFFNVTDDLLLSQYGSLNSSLSTTGALSIYFNFSKEVDNFMKLFINYNSNNFTLDFMNKTVSWCKVLQMPRYEPFVKIIYKVVSDKSHLPKECPIKKNHLYYVRNFFFDTKDLPPVFPESIITIKMEFWDSVKDDLLKVAEIGIMGQVKRY